MKKEMRNFILVFLGCLLFFSGMVFNYLAVSLLDSQQQHETKLLGEGLNYFGKQIEVTGSKDARIKATLRINFDEGSDGNIRYQDYPFKYQVDMKIESDEGDILVDRKSFIDWRDNSRNLGVRNKENSFVVQNSVSEGDSLDMDIIVFFSRFRVPKDGIIDVSIELKANDSDSNKLIASTFFLDHDLSTLRVDNFIYGVLFTIVGCILLVIGAASLVTRSSPKLAAASNDDVDSSTVRRKVAICHASALCGYLIPFAGVLAVFLLWKNNRRDNYSDTQGLECLNFQLSTLIYLSLSFALSLFLIGFIMMLLVLLLHCLLTVKAVVVTLRGDDWRYPLVFRLLS